MTSPTLLSEEEELRLLKTIESDVEFRYAIAGVLGISSLLDELRKLREDFNKRFEEVNKRIEEHSNRIEELTKVVGELKVGVGSLGRRLGRGLEKTILKLYERVLAERDVEAERVERFVYRDVDGRLYRRGARIEVDVSFTTK
jgi:hypothetical protein